MIGDEIVVKPHHTKAAENVYNKIKDKVLNANEGDVIAITVAGESGSGKSETATEIARLFKENHDLPHVVFHQDDYFVHPPKTNDQRRKENIHQIEQAVGTHEVKLDLLDKHLSYVKDPDVKRIEKPLVDFHKDQVLSETHDLDNVKLVVAEGTYTTALKNADIKVFIDKDYKDTLEHRKERARDELDENTDKILQIEHEIISKHKEQAHVIVPKEPKEE